jgi:hypothetical protein
MTRNGMKDGQRNRLNRLGATAFLLAGKNTDVEGKEPHQFPKRNIVVNAHEMTREQRAGNPRS